MKPDPKTYVLRASGSQRIIEVGITQDAARRYQRRQHVSLSVEQAKRLIGELQRRVAEAELANTAEERT